MDIEERESIDEQEYVLERLHEGLSEAQVTGDDKKAADITQIISAVQHHGPTHGTSVAGTDERACEYDGERYPCSALKLNARSWQGRDDFPKHLF